MYSVEPGLGIRADLDGRGRARWCTPSMARSTNLICCSIMNTIELCAIALLGPIKKNAFGIPATVTPMWACMPSVFHRCTNDSPPPTTDIQDSTGPVRLNPVA